MTLLLDTHAFLWWCTDDARLSAAARQAISDETNPIYVSVASAWEISTKYRLGKLGSAGEAVQRFDELVKADGFQHLPVTHIHALKAGAYEASHRDPFDRMLAAQSELERMPLVTVDPAFSQFNIRTFW